MSTILRFGLPINTGSTPLAAVKSAQMLPQSGRTSFAGMGHTQSGVCGNECSAAAKIMHGFIELFISKRRIKANADNADLPRCRQGEPHSFKLAQKRRSSDGIDKLTPCGGC